MRKYLVVLHRWFGLTMAVFLFIAGATGAVISWDHELDEWLNPHLFKANSTGQYQDALQLANTLEQRDSTVLVTYLPLNIEAEHTLGIGVNPRMNPQTGKAYALGYNQIGLNPVNGEIQGKRLWGEVSLSRENLLPFLYKLHYSMHIPDAWGIELGVLFMGIIAIIWVLDNLIALWISFPNVKSWRKSFAFRWKQGGHKLNFDLHRSGGVWVWLLLLLLAVTSVSMNLNFQVMRPIVETFSTLTPNPFASRIPNPEDQPIEPGIKREAILEIAKKEAVKRGWTAPAGAVFYSPAFGIYGVGFFEAGHDHGDGGLGNPWLYFDGKNGAPTGTVIPGSGSAGDIFMQAQFPLHSGRILGIPGRVMISIMGAVVAMLSITGIIIWLRKRKARLITKAA
ncbi:PepSY domain-containing protein [Methylobacillus gramineus]|uniref:PepSY-associated TM helix domain-containing protein n=1 Tax=Methylobacillus gramineus TaxID=755169 RepID=UPI001CFFFF83|nr:PepSY-associated TM helix domain-containing protein [Methylobacillus gramineus]MCB5185920.1 PepSY domain-containing protein [Methylobacillus gramineus]